VTDRRSGVRFLVNTSAEASVIPPSLTKRKQCQEYSRLQAINGTSIATSGSRLLTLNLVLRRMLRWVFTIANIQSTVHTNSDLWFTIAHTQPSFKTMGIHDCRYPIPNLCQPSHGPSCHHCLDAGGCHQQILWTFAPWSAVSSLAVSTKQSVISGQLHRDR
jgi:hypothetical protein